MVASRDASERLARVRWENQQRCGHAVSPKALTAQHFEIAGVAGDVHLAAASSVTASDAPPPDTDDAKEWSDANVHPHDAPGQSTEQSEADIAGAANTCASTV